MQWHQIEKLKQIVWLCSFCAYKKKSQGKKKKTKATYQLIESFCVFW
jgi:hypothetical protein